MVMEDPVHASSLVGLRDLVVRLTATTDVRAGLAVVMDHLQPWRPHTGELVLVEPGADGHPLRPRAVVTWQDGHVLGDSPERLVDDLPAALWSTPPAALDLATTVLLPLHTDHGGWLGALRLTWAVAHARDEGERAVHDLVAPLLAAHLAGMRTWQSLRDAVAERDFMQDLSHRMHVAATLDDRLRALVLAAPDSDDAEVSLGTFEHDEHGAPTWLTMISCLPPRGRPAGAPIGSRYHLPSFPFARLYLDNPDTPVLISDIQHDPRLDAASRVAYAYTGAHATIAMALTLQGRWIGLLNVTWSRPVALGDRELRLYTALSKLAALQLDNSMMVDRLRASLHDTRAQGELLQTVLDHVPAGILLLEGSGRPILTNPTARRFGLQVPPTDATEIASQPYTLVYPGTDRPIPFDELAGVRTLRSGTRQSDFVDVIGASNRRVHLEVTGVPLLAAGVVQRVLLVLDDITARKHAEDERVQLQEQVIRVQAAALAERSSPIIPITDDILVLPIVGSIDVERGQQVLAAILEGASQRRAKVAIIDITGVQSVDAAAAAALTGAARALRLLGVEPVLSGIRPDVAQTLVGLGLGLDGITTCSTLQSSIQHALRRLGRTGFADR